MSRYISLSLVMLLASSLCHAGLPPTTAKSSADATDVTTFVYRFPNFTGTHTGTVFSLGVNSIAGGGTGQSTKANAFDALSPMTTQYDLIIGGASGTGVRLPKGADATRLTTSGGVVGWTADPSPYSVATVNSNTTATSGTTYLADTSGGAFNITLPSPVANAFIIIKDKTGSFQTNNLTVVRAGSESIEGLAASKVLQTNWGSFTLFSDGTNWYML